MTLNPLYANLVLPYTKEYCCAMQSYSTIYVYFCLRKVISNEAISEC